MSMYQKLKFIFIFFLSLIGLLLFVNNIYAIEKKESGIIPAISNHYKVKPFYHFNTMPADQKTNNIGYALL